ncbi:MAG: hypothetical protein HOF74_10525 [Gammaproteobacteria bacterium]|jgi:hypothetical protein|nr:hypothetical protein [Gammaproteobacteria bacterium]MBT3860256.1 hypothetical protein [Gammaproteobacteria bacterium]MBT3987548.1 hypothetical protein [Gammaproteobacteria bacterium]MBT4581714.1 hypothetical protein [Gammaproteobacteria bacterium]MBT4659574.1 hypothetical protein [Gammaproteobacteria bacterium]
MKIMTAILSAISLTLLTTSVSLAQEWEVPRTANGNPDLQGIWTNATQTPLQRPREFGEKGFLTLDEAVAQQEQWKNNIARGAADSDPDRAPPTDGDTDLGYNGFWIDRGTNVVEINGEYRTSIVVDPPNGRIPMLEGFSSNAMISKLRGMPGVEPYDGHELRPLGERCLLSFGSSSGPPMLPVMYNNNYQIVQTEDHVMIMVEMVHDARIIPLNKTHFDTDLEKWMGDSVGYWDGDALIVETRNFHPFQSYRGSSEDLIVSERFELISEDKIKYSFTMDDPQSYQANWTGEIAMNRRPEGDRMYEYACHEGNYAFPGILGGARRLEAEQASR